MITFGGFRLDTRTRQLRYRGSERRLRAKSAAVLLYLARHPDRLVTHRELFRAVWPDTAVSPTVLRVCIREIRAAFGAEADRFLTTVPRRGYRFTLDASANGGSSPIFVGRREETSELHEALARARGGRRQVVLLAGEAGAGKTALLDHFIDEIRSDETVRVARGQSLESHVGSEGYAPLLDLLNRVCGQADGDDVVQALVRWAPSWLLQLPGRIDDVTADRLRARVGSPNRERRLRELSEAAEHLASEKLLVAVVEDLHWSDASTLDAFTHLAERDAAARLLVIGSYRPEALRDHHPAARARQRLRSRGLCSEIRLGRLAPEHVSEYLSRRLAPQPLGDGLADGMHQHSGGHALFLVTMVDHLLDRHRLAVNGGVWRIQGKLAGTVPDAVGQLVSSMVDTLQAEQLRILEAASVVGSSFAAAPVASATGMSIEAVEDHCNRLAGRRLITEAGVDVWPDGTASGRFEFSHAVYGEALYDRLAPAARLRLHRAVGERIEAGHRERTGEVASTLARHFELAGDRERAMHFHAEAAASARRHSTPLDEISHREAALAMVRAMPATDERAAAELDHLLGLGAATVAARGYSAPEIGAVYGRAHTLAARLGAMPARITAIGGLYTRHLTRAEPSLAAEKARDLLSLAERVADPVHAAVGNAWLGFALFNLGKFEDASAYLERARGSWVTGASRLPGHGVSFRGVLALSLLVGGRSAAAAAALEEMLAYAARSGDDAFDHAQAHGLAAQFHAVAGRRRRALHHAERSLALATEHGFTVHRASAMIFRGWAIDDVAVIREGLAIHGDIGQRVTRTLFEALLAEALLENGETNAALDTITGALAFASETGEARHLAELHRLRAECLRHRRNGDGKPAPEALKASLASLHAAIDVARHQKAKLWERRALNDLRTTLASANGGGALRA